MARQTENIRISQEIFNKTSGQLDKHLIKMTSLNFCRKEEFISFKTEIERFYKTTEKKNIRTNKKFLKIISTFRKNSSEKFLRKTAFYHKILYYVFTLSQRPKTSNWQNFDTDFTAHRNI